MNLEHNEPTRAAAMKIERLPSVLARTGMSRSAAYAAIAAGTFVRPIKLTGARAIGFLASEVDAWIAARVAERDSAVAGEAPANARRL